jgi:hypothetical protein
MLICTCRLKVYKQNTQRQLQNYLMPVYGSDACGNYRVSLSIGEKQGPENQGREAIRSQQPIQKRSSESFDITSVHPQPVQRWKQQELTQK